MKKVLALFLMALMLVAGCVTSSDDSDKDSNDSGNNNSGQTVFSVTGQVKTADGGQFGGVTVTMIGTNYQKMATTDKNGVYTFIQVPKGDYAVTPVMEGYTFEPATKLVSIATDDITNLVFTAVKENGGGTSGEGSFSISGKVVDETGKPIALAEVMLVGTAITTYSDANGVFTFTNLKAGSYVASLEKEGYAFSTDYSIITITDASVSDIVFTGVVSGGNTSGYYTIFGQIVDSNDSPVAGADVYLSGTHQASTITNSNGEYTFTEVPNGTYAVTPSKSGYTFTPLTMTVTVNGLDVAVALFHGQTAGGSDSGSGSAGSHTYFPLKTGATWHTTEKAAIEGYEEYADITNHTYTVTGTTNLYGTEYWVYDSTSTDEYGTYTDSSHFRIDGDVVYSYENDLMFGATKAASSDKVKGLAKALSAMKKAANDDVPMFKFNVSAGTTWTVMDGSYSYSGENVTVNQTAKYVGTVSVTVPTGTFNNCKKFDYTYVYTVTNGTDTSTLTETTTIWLAANVGMVKTTSVWTDSGITYNQDEELTSYNIP